MTTVGASGVKAAIIKCATDTEGVTPVIETILRASARAQKATGVPISSDILPALRAAGVTTDQIDQMLVRNPRAIFEAVG